MAFLKVQKGLSSNLNNVPIEDGQILFTTDTKQLYLDNDDTRLECGKDFAYFDEDDTEDLPAALPINADTLGGQTANQLFATFFEIEHPIGSLYLSSSNTDNPNSKWSAFGISCTWELVPDVFLLGSGNLYNLKETGGEAKHTLTVGEMPEHRHDEALMIEGYSGWSELTTTTYSILFSRDCQDYGIKYNSGGETFNAARISACTTTSSAGYGGAHNNMPPYLAVNIWKRIS